MNDSTFRRDNHYVPGVYLKRFASESGKVWTRRLLVSHERANRWREARTKSVAFQAHLYTQIVAGAESDAFERWLDREFESPSDEAITKATTGARMSSEDWRRLVRFLASQDLRTPARFLDDVKRWNTTMPEIMEQSLQYSLTRWRLAKAQGIELVAPVEPEMQIPMRVSREASNEPGMTNLVVEMAVGRELWIENMKRLLTSTIEVLLRHRWTVLRAPRDLEWITSDNPVIRLNLAADGRYSLGGGWGSHGTEIMLPLDPRHLLYTQIGRARKERGSMVSTVHAALIRRVIAENAYRMIFASRPIADIESLRPVVVSHDEFRREEIEWKRWHEEQTRAALSISRDAES